MRTVDVVAHILKREGIQYLSAYPTTPVIEAAAEVGIRPVICRQERVGVGIADGYTRVNNGAPAGVFAMQYGPGAENAFAGVATAFSDAVPMLILPLGHPRERDGVFPHFSSVRSYSPVTKHVEQMNTAGRVVQTMQRAFNNSTMAIETAAMATSRELFRTRDLGGNYADMAAAMGGWSERVEDPSEVGPAILRARSAAEEGRAALLEFITGEEIDFSYKRAFT